MSCAERLSGCELEQSFPGERALAGFMRTLEACIP